MKDLKIKIAELESAARILEPGKEQRNALNQQVINYANEFLNKNEQLNGFNRGHGDLLAQIPISNEGKDISSLLKVLANDVDLHGINPSNKGHLGYIPGGGIYPASLGDYLAAVANRYAGVYYASPGAVIMENQLIRWLCDLVGYPPSSAGNLTSGGSVANLIAVITARDHHQIEGEVISKSVIYSTNQMHHSLHKAVRMAGLKNTIHREIDMNSKYQMDIAELTRAIKEDKENGLNPFLVIISAGTADTGAIDPLNEVGLLCNEHNIWCHVDAAYGGFFMLCEEESALLAGMEKADSIVIDPHKGLFLPYGIGAVLVRDKRHLEDSFSFNAEYMQDANLSEGELSPTSVSPELSKHFRGMRMWLPLQLFGTNAFAAALKEKLLLAKYAYNIISGWDDFETGPEPELSVLIFRYLPKEGNPNHANKLLLRKIVTEEKVFLSSTNIDGKFYIRIAILNFRTHLDTIDATLNLIKQKATEID